METETDVLFDGYDPAPQPVESEPEPLAFGALVTFTRHLTRRYRPDVKDRGYIWRKVWESGGYPGEPDPAPRAGLLIGVRTLSNGESRYHGYDEPIEYRPQESFRAYLVAYDLRRKPVLVLPEHLTPLTNGE